MSNDLSGFSMFELFKEEAKLHAATLSSGLLAAEVDRNDPQHFQSLMRAAHSIKGAARIIGLDVIVDLAHAMEDRFVTFQAGGETLTAERVDQLLKGVDLIEELADIDEAAVDAWSQTHAEACQALARQLTQPLSPQSPPKAAEVQGQKTEAADAESSSPVPADVTEPLSSDLPPRAHATEPPEPLAPDAPSAANAATETRPLPSATDLAEDPASVRSVPVSSENLNRIMRLASESMIQSRRLQSLERSLSKMRDVQRQVGELNERLVQLLKTSELRTETNRLCELSEENRRLLQSHGERLDQASWRAEQTSTALYHEVIGCRMRPFAEGTIAFPRMIRDLARSLGKQVTLEVIGQAVAVDRDILRKLEAPLNHILRNCVDHGIESPQDRIAAGKSASGTITLHARHHAGMLTVEVRDDGRGIDSDALRHRIVDRGLESAELAAQLSPDELWEFLFLPGFSTASAVTEVSGRGVGLDVVRTMVQEVSGSVVVSSEIGQSTQFSLRLPVTLSVVRAVIVEIGGEPYAIPLSKLSRVSRVPDDELKSVQGKLQVRLGNRSVGLIRATEILGLPNDDVLDADPISVVVFGPDHALCGLVVDRFCGEQDLVVRPLDSQLGKVEHISAAAVNESGDALLIVDVEDLYQSIQQRLGEGRIRGMTRHVAPRRQTQLRILVVDDSVTVREVERQLLMQHGYSVDVAVDGQDGWNRLKAGDYDLLITDVDMPRMNGIALIKAVRSETKFAALPIIVVSYKDRAEDRMAGLESGANAYLTKGSFHDDSFLSTVVDLIGDHH